MYQYRSQQQQPLHTAPQQLQQQQQMQHQQEYYEEKQEQQQQQATQQQVQQQQQQQQPDPREQERRRRLRQYQNDYENLKAELEEIKKDIAVARETRQPTGPLFTEKQRIEDKMKAIEIEVAKNRDPARPGAPADLNENQFAISTSVIRRKSAAETKKN